MGGSPFFVRGLFQDSTSDSLLEFPGHLEAFQELESNDYPPPSFNAKPYRSGVFQVHAR